MAYNTVAEIKQLLLLESENATLSDDLIQTYIDDAQEELYGLIHRNRETDAFHITPDKLSSTGVVEFTLFFRAESVAEVRDITTNAVISSDDYDLIRGEQAIQIRAGSGDANLAGYTDIEVDYIPKNYKLAERAIVMENILSRLEPFQNEQINPTLLVWRSKKKNFLRMIEGNFGTGSFH